jgi:FkbM family methyltransferase
MSMIKTFDFIVSHPLNHGERLKALSRFIGWQFRSRFQGEVIFEWIGGAKLAVRRSMTGATGNIYCGLHEYRDMSFLLHLLTRNDLFVDVGANIGSYTVLASAVCRAKSIAIEPDPTTAQALSRNISLNGIGELVEQCVTAVGADEGVILFTSGLDTMNRVASGTDTAVQTVPVAKLDDLIGSRSPTLIKIDVEGYEAEVLMGARRTLESASLRAILLETVNEASRHLLTDAGFEEVKYDPATRSFESGKAPTSPNSLFIRDRDVLSRSVVLAPTRRFYGKEL